MKDWVRGGIYSLYDNLHTKIFNYSGNIKKESLKKFLESPFELKIKKNITNKLYNILLKIKNAQEMIYKNEKKINYNFIDFVKECLNLKLNQSKINEVIRINDTLNMIVESESNHIIVYIKQMKIILKIFKDINDKFSRIDSKYNNISFNSQVIEKIELIKEPIMKLKLLKEIIINKSIYNQKIQLFIYDNNLALLDLVDNYIKKEILSNLIEFSIKLIYVICLLNKKKINFFS